MPLPGRTSSWCWTCLLYTSLDTAIVALIQVQQYQKIGTVGEVKKLASMVDMVERDSLAKVIDEWNEYRKIGAIDECRQAVEKQNKE